MAGGYQLPDGSFQEDTSNVSAPKPLPVDSVCGAAEEPQPAPQTTEEETN